MAGHRPAALSALLRAALVLEIESVAIDRGAAAGVTVQPPAAGELVLLHDARVDRTTDGAGEVCVGRGESGRIVALYHRSSASYQIH
jgi:glycerophosphoryl diester phosphodiesterase